MSWCSGSTHVANRSISLRFDDLWAALGPGSGFEIEVHYLRGCMPLNDLPPQLRANSRGMHGPLGVMSGLIELSLQHAVCVRKLWRAMQPVDDLF